MKTPERLESAELERRESQLTLFAGSAIVVLAAGLALLMYPAVFSNHGATPNRTPQIAFFGFCALSCLLVVYVVDRQRTIQGLRHQITTDRERTSEALRRASAELLETLPNYNAFEDRLSMEFRRAAAAGLNLSVVLVTIKLRDAFAEPSFGMSALGDAARAISRKLREEDSLYILRPAFFGVILPGVDKTVAERVSARLTEGLSDAAGANDRFSAKMDALSFPEQSSSAHDLERAVCELLPEEVQNQATVEEVPASR
jgi:GGDEF domain-containing protein